jgi:excisionase family DNA binding protein
MRGRPDETHLRTVAEVVRITGLSERTIRAMLSDGRLEAVRLVGLRAVRIPERALLNLIRPRP